MGLVITRTISSKFTNPHILYRNEFRIILFKKSELTADIYVFLCLIISSKPGWFEPLCPACIVHCHLFIIQVLLKQEVILKPVQLPLRLRMITHNSWLASLLLTVHLGKQILLSHLCLMVHRFLPDFPHQIILFQLPASPCLKTDHWLALVLN